MEIKDSYTFPKRERIVSQKLIDELFTGDSSHSLAAFPIRVVYMAGKAATDTNARKPTEPLQILVSVPKKRFKHAVDRNHVKRQIREAWRHNKQLLPQINDGQTLRLAFIWLSDRQLPSADIDKKVKNLLTRIAQKL